MAKKASPSKKGNSYYPAHSEFEYRAAESPVGAGEYEESGMRRYLVSVVRHSCRLLDEDNLAGGAKYHIDSLRRAGLIPEDSPGFVKLSFDQVKVSKKSDERTETTIEMIDSI